MKQRTIDLTDRLVFSSKEASGRVSTRVGERVVTMALPKRTFLIGGLYGLLVLVPQYVLEGKMGRDFSPPITHPEYYYGFIGVAVAWQIAFFVLAKDPVRYRVFMIPAIVEKASFGIAVGVLFALNRVNLPMLAAGFLDLIFGALFVVAYMRTPVSRYSVNRLGFE